MGRVAVRVTPRAGGDAVLGFRGGVLRVRVAAAPVDGKANAAVARLLAAALRVTPSKVTVIRGAGSRDKVVEIDGLSVEAIRRRFG